MPAKKWTLPLFLEAAACCKTRQELRVHNSAAFSAGQKYGWLDEAPHLRQRVKRGTWAKERCHEEALKYQCQADFMKGCRSAHSTASQKGWLQDICGHMDLAKSLDGYWTKERCHEEALKHNTKASFKYSNRPTAYQKARANGWLKDICGHMTRGRVPSTTVYMWRVVGEYYNGKSIYKIGVSSPTRVADRIRAVAARGGMKRELLFHVTYPTEAQAHEAETQLLSFGEDPKLSVDWGKTEFRAMDLMEREHAVLSIGVL